MDEADRSQVAEQMTLLGGSKLEPFIVQKEVFMFRDYCRAHLRTALLAWRSCR